MAKIQKNQETIEENNVYKSHWIIINHKRNKIWKQPFLTYEGAKAELDYQVSRLRTGQKHNWEIEKRGWIEKIEKDDFEEFNQEVLANF